jgi:hypothetical protein
MIERKIEIPDLVCKEILLDRVYGVSNLEKSKLQSLTGRNNGCIGGKKCRNRGVGTMDRTQAGEITSDKF